MRNIDVSDTQIHIEVFTQILMEKECLAHCRGKKNVLLIAEDMNFLHIMQQFPDTNFLIAVNDDFDIRLINPPLAVWRWTMIEGGRPMHWRYD